MMFCYVKKSMGAMAPPAGTVEKFAPWRAHELIAEGVLEQYDPKKHRKADGSLLPGAPPDEPAQSVKPIKR